MENRPIVTVRQAESPREAEWVVEWRSPLVAGPSYLYFPSREEAEEAAARIGERLGSAEENKAGLEAKSQVQPDRIGASPVDEVLRWGRRLLGELPKDVCPEAASELERALNRLQEDADG